LANSNTFQIIGGEYRGRRFSFPDADGLRPTPSKVRETLFNWIQFESFNKTYLVGNTFAKGPRLEPMGYEVPENVFYKDCGLN